MHYTLEAIIALLTTHAVAWSLGWWCSWVYFGRPVEVIEERNAYCPMCGCNVQCRIEWSDHFTWSVCCECGEYLDEEMT